MFVFQARANTHGVEMVSGAVEGIAQVARVPALSLTARPKYVFCGADVPCPEITPKTLNIQVAVVPAPSVTEPVVVPAKKREPMTATVNFAFGSYRLTAAARDALSGLVSAAMAAGGDMRITIDGYTDAVGTKNFNDRLARKRAAAVKKHLITAGVPPERVRIGKTIGKCCYVKPNDTEAGRAANRRAEVVSLSVSFE